MWRQGPFFIPTQRKPAVRLKKKPVSYSVFLFCILLVETQKTLWNIHLKESANKVMIKIKLLHFRCPNSFLLHSVNAKISPASAEGNDISNVSQLQRVCEWSCVFCCGAGTTKNSWEVKLRSRERLTLPSGGQSNELWWPLIRRVWLHTLAREQEQTQSGGGGFHREAVWIMHVSLWPFPWEKPSHRELPLGVSAFRPEHSWKESSLHKQTESASLSRSEREKCPSSWEKMQEI